MRFNSDFSKENQDVPGSYNLYAYSQIKSQEIHELIQISNKFLSTFMTKNNESLTESDITVFLKTLYMHYDAFYDNCLQKFRSTVDLPQEMLNNLKTILQYEYTFSKLINFQEGSEDLSRLVELLTNIQDPDLLALILRIISEKVKDKDYTKGWKKQDLHWQALLNRFAQIFFEFFSQITFENFLENFGEAYKRSIERAALTSLLGKVELLASTRKSFIQFRDYLKAFLKENKELSEDSATEITKHFRQSKASDVEIHPENYEIAAILSLLVLARRLALQQDKKLLNFIIICEKLRVALNSVNTPILLPKFKQGEQKWTPLAFKCLDIFNQEEFKNEIPLEYLCLLQDLAPIYKFLLVKSRVNNDFYSVYHVQTILKHAEKMGKQNSFCMPVSSILDEALIEYISTLRKYIFLSYEKHIQEIGENVVGCLIDSALSDQLDSFTFQQLSSFCSEVFAADKRFVSFLNRPTYCLMLFENLLPKMFESLHHGTRDLKSILSGIEYITEILCASSADTGEMGDLFNNLKSSAFIKNLPSYVEDEQIKQILTNMPELYVKILNFVLEYDNKNSEILNDEKYSRLIIEAPKVLLSSKNLSSETITNLIFKIFDKISQKESLRKSVHIQQTIEDLLVAFFSISALNAVPVENLAEYFILKANSEDFLENKRKISAITQVLGRYRQRAQDIFETLLNSPLENGNGALHRPKFCVELEILASELILGPLRLIQIMLEFLPRKQDVAAKEIIDQCKSFLPVLTDIIMSPVMLFAPQDFISSQKHVKNIIKRAQYLTFLSDRLGMDYFARIVEDITQITLLWPSAPQVRLISPAAFLQLFEADYSKLNELNVASTLIHNSIKYHVLSKAEYLFLNTMSTIFSFKEYLSEVKGKNLKIGHLVENGTWHSVQQKFEDLAPVITEIIISFVMTILSSAESKSLKGNNSSSGNKVFEQWYIFLRTSWLCLISLTAFCNSNRLYNSISNLVFQQLIGAASSNTQSPAIAQQFIASACSLPNVLSTWKNVMLRIQDQGKTLAGAGFFKTVELKSLMERIEKLDIVSTVNSFIKGYLQDETSESFEHTLSDIESFYQFLNQNEYIQVNFRGTLDFVQELNIIQIKLYSKEKSTFASDVKKYLNNIILRQLRKTTQKDHSAVFDWDVANKEILALATDILSKPQESLRSSPENTIRLVEALSARFVELCLKSDEALDWTKLSQNQYPISENIILQTIKAFKNLSTSINFGEGSSSSLKKEKKESFLADISKLFEKITYEARAYLSYTFLQGTKDTKSFQSEIISSCLEIVHSFDKSEELVTIFSQESFLKGLWLLIYNLIIIDRTAAEGIIQQGLLESLLKKEYSNEITWETCSLALLVFDLYFSNSLPPRDLLELNLKLHFALNNLEKVEFKELIKSDFLTFVMKSIKQEDLYSVLSHHFTMNIQKDQEAICEIQPKLLATLQTASEASKNVNIVEGVTQLLSPSVKKVLDVLINTIVTNYSYAVVQQRKEDSDKQTKRRLTSELIYQLSFVLAKYPHLSSYIFLKEIDTRIVRAEQVPDFFPYSKFANQDKVLFLEFLLRIVLKVDKAYSFLILDFTRLSGFVADVVKEGEQTKRIDFNHVLFSKFIQLINELIDEEISTGRISASYDAVETIKSIMHLLIYYLTKERGIKNLEMAKFLRYTVHKTLDWVTALDKKSLANDQNMSNIPVVLNILEKQFSFVNSDKDLKTYRDENYLKLLESFEDFHFAEKEEGPVLQYRNIFEDLAAKISTNNQTKTITKSSTWTESAEDTVKTSKGLLCYTIQDKASEFGLGFSKFYVENPAHQGFSVADLDNVKGIQESIDKQLEECNFYFLRTPKKENINRSELGRKLQNPKLGILSKNLIQIMDQFSLKYDIPALLSKLAEDKEKKPPKPTSPEKDVNIHFKEKAKADDKAQQPELEVLIPNTETGIPPGEEKIIEILLEEAPIIPPERVLIPSQLFEKIMNIVGNEPDKYTDFINRALDDNLFLKLEETIDDTAVISVINSAAERFIGNTGVRQEFLDKVFTKDPVVEEIGAVENQKQTHSIPPMELFKIYVKPSLGVLKKRKLEVKEVKKHWFKMLNETKKNVRQRIEDALLQLRLSLLNKPSIDKLSLSNLEGLLDSDIEVEKEYFVATFYDLSPEYLDETVKERALKAKKIIQELEKLIPQEDDDSNLASLLDIYKTSLIQAKEKKKPKKTETEVEGGNQEVAEEEEEKKEMPYEEIPESKPEPIDSLQSDSVPGSIQRIPSVTSIQAKPPPKFTLTANVRFCKTEIKYEELMPGKRQFAKASIEAVEKVTPEIQERFTNYLCCSDKQIEGLVEFLYLESMGANVWVQGNKTAELFIQVCLHPVNEIKIIDTLLFLLLHPHIYQENDTPHVFPFKMASDASLLGLSSPEKVYSTFAENTLIFLKYLMTTLKLRFIYPLITSLRHYTIASIHNLKNKYKYHDRTFDMHCVLDLILSLASVPEIKKDKKLTNLLDDLIKSIIGYVQTFKSRFYSLNITSKHLEYLMKTYGLDEVVKTFQGSPKLFMTILPSIFEVLLSSLKQEIEKANKIVTRLKEIEKVPKEQQQALLEPIEKASEFADIIKAVYITVETFFNYLFRSSYLFWKAADYKDLVDKETYKIIENSLKNIRQELNQEDLELFMLSIFEILEVYSRIIGKDNFTYQHIQEKSAILKFIEFGIYLYSIIEMKNRIDQEVIDDEDDSPVPKLSKMVSKDYTEKPRKMERSFTSFKGEKNIDFDVIFTNFALRYMKVISSMCSLHENDATGGLILLLCERYPFMLNIDTQRAMIKKMYKEFFYKGEWPSRREIKIDRNRIVSSFAEKLQELEREELARVIKFSFEGELGIDEGGLTREIYTVLAQELFDPDKGLFRPSANNLSIQPRPDSAIVPNHLKLFEFAGIIIAKAIIGDVTVDFTFTKSFLKHCLGRKIAISDLSDLDPDLAKNTQWTLDNDVTDLGLTFSYDTYILGQTVRRELIENGFEIEVDQCNKKEYVMKLCEALMTQEIGPQLEAFLKGFRAILPAKFLSHLSPADLGLLISGAPIIDLEDMKKTCKYENFQGDSDLAKWFWEVVSEFTKEELASFMYFISGSTKVPTGGFQTRPVVLRMLDHLHQESLPIAHTCFYTLDLPNYKSKDKVREKLLLGLYEGKEGFHIA